MLTCLTDSQTGTILFGGYDRGKYIDPLSVLQIQTDPGSGTISSFTVSWFSLTLTDSRSTFLLQPEDFPILAVLDTGTTVTQVPQDTFQRLAEFFGAEQKDNGWAVPCEIANWKGTLDYRFGSDNGPVIKVRQRNE